MHPQSLDRVAVLIPVWQPCELLSALVATLVAQGCGAVLVVNDGSDKKHSSLFDELTRLPHVHVLHHAVNLGKGRALKTGMSYFLGELPELDGLVTADADGQHTPADIMRVAQTLLSFGERVILGARTFSSVVPWRSRLGNGLTRHIFAFVTGTKLGDTQTGLRGLPRRLLPQLMVLEGERYEYEMIMLAHICRMGDVPLELPIQTLYLDGNRASHFNPVLDSMRIYFVLVRFYFRRAEGAPI